MVSPITPVLITRNITPSKGSDRYDEGDGHYQCHPHLPKGQIFGKNTPEHAILALFFDGIFQVGDMSINWYHDVEYGFVSFNEAPNRVILGGSENLKKGGVLVCWWRVGDGGVEWKSSPLSS